MSATVRGVRRNWDLYLLIAPVLICILGHSRYGTEYETEKAGSDVEVSANKPNIVLINCDDLGYGDLGCYGSPVHRTPVLDRMAEEGIRYTDFYMAAPLCSPSRGAMLTGCYPKRIGFGTFEGRQVLFPGQGVGLNPKEHTMAKALKEQGYSTMLVGKWHCGDQPEFLPSNHGFDHYYGLPYSNDMGRQTGREDYPPLPLMLDDDVLQEQPDQASLTERYIEQSVRFIRQNKDTPFFLYLAHMHVHLPLYVPDRFLKQSRNGAYGAAVEGTGHVHGLSADVRRFGGGDAAGSARHRREGYSPDSSERTGCPLALRGVLLLPKRRTAAWSARRL